MCVSLSLTQELVEKVLNNQLFREPAIGRVGKEGGSSWYIVCTFENWVSLGTILQLGQIQELTENRIMKFLLIEINV